MMAGRLVAPVVLALALACAASDACGQYTPYPDAIWNRGGSERAITSVTFTPDSRYLVSASTEGDIKVWEAETSALVRILARTGEPITCLEFTPDGSTLAAALDNGRVEFLDARTGRFQRGVNAHDGPANSVAFSTDGRYFVTGGEDGLVKLWETGSGRLVKVFTGHTYVVNQVDFSSRGELVSGSDDFTLKVWDTATGKAIRTFVWMQGQVGCAGFSPDGRLVAGVAGLGFGKIYNVDTGLEFYDFKVGAGLQLHFDSEGKAIIVACRGVAQTGAASAFDFVDGGTGGWATPSICNSVAFSPDGRFMASGGDDHDVIIGRRDSGPVSGDYVHATEHLGAVTALGVSNDESRIVSGGADARVEMRERSSGRILWTSHTHVGIVETDAIRSLAFSRDDRLVASASDDGTVRIHDAATGEVIKNLYGSSEWSIKSTMFQPGTGRVAGGIGNGDSVVKLWDTARMDPVRTFNNQAPVNALAFTPNGEYLIAAGEDHDIKIWRVETGELITTIVDHRSSITTLAVSADGRMLASGSSDRTVRVWDLPSGDLIRELNGHTQPVTAVSFYKEDHLLSASADGTIRVWEIASGNEVNRYSAHPHIPLSLVVAADNSAFATGSADGTTILWKLNLVSGVAGSTRALDSRITEHAVRPNPVRSRATLAFGLKSPGRTLVRLYDSHGALAAAVFDGELDAGRHRLGITTGELSAGLYFYRIVSGGADASGSLVISR